MEALLAGFEAELLSHVGFHDAAEVIAVDRQFHGYREAAGSFEHRGEHEPPVVALALLLTAQYPEGVPQRPEVVQSQVGALEARRLELAQERPHALVVLLR